MPTLTLRNIPEALHDKFGSLFLLGRFGHFVLFLAG